MRRLSRRRFKSGVLPSETLKSASFPPQEDLGVGFGHDLPQVDDLSRVELLVVQVGVGDAVDELKEDPLKVVEDGTTEKGLGHQ